MELLGTPTLEDMKSACEGAKAHILRQGHKPPSMAALYTLSAQATHEAVHLLCRMLVFNPVSASENSLLIVNSRKDLKPMLKVVLLFGHCWTNVQKIT